MVAMANNSGEVNGEEKDGKNKQSDHAAMKAKNLSFKKRKDCIMKKSMELSVLCGIKVCSIIVGPDGKVETWPENSDNIMEMLKLYQDFGVSNDGCKGKKKSRKKSGVDNHEAALNLQHESEDVDDWIRGLSETSLNELLTETNPKMSAVANKIDSLRRNIVVDDDRVNDHSGATVVCAAKKAMDQSINGPISFLNTNMVGADDHQVAMNFQREWEDFDGWIEGLSETSTTIEFLTEISAKMNTGGSKIDISRRNNMVGDRMNDQSMAATMVVCASEKARDQSIIDPINFLNTNVVADDQMKDSMPVAVVLCDGEEAKEESIIKDQINPLYCYDDHQDIDEWLNTLVNWNGFEKNALVLDSDY